MALLSKTKVTQTQALRYQDMDLITWTPDFGLQNCEGIKYSICGNWLWQPWGASMVPLEHCCEGKAQFSTFPYRNNPGSPAVCFSPMSLLCYSHTLSLQSPHVWGGISPTTSKFLWYQLGILQFNSVLTPSTQRSCRLRAQPHKTALPPICTDRHTVDAT